MKISKLINYLTNMCWNGQGTNVYACFLNSLPINKKLIFTQEAFGWFTQVVFRSKLFSSYSLGHFKMVYAWGCKRSMYILCIMNNFIPKLGWQCKFGAKNKVGDGRFVDFLKESFWSCCYKCMIIIERVW
jgi:hypothetical protein